MQVKFTGDFDKFTEAIRKIGEKQTRATYRKVINATGAKLRQDAVKIMPEQSGLQKGTIRRALGEPVRATGQTLAYKLTTKGGFVRLKYFGARETPQGVFATPRGINTFYPKQFIKGGLFPARKILPFSGHVFKVVSGKQWGRPIDRGSHSGVRIPDELVKGDMKRAFDRRSAEFEDTVDAEIERLTQGVVSRK